MRITLLGAECTGKSTLTAALGAALGPRAATVGEYLREWCLAAQRTPLQHEQTHIAQEQARRIAQAAARHAVVVADTTALMTALYSIHYFQDHSLMADALAAQRHFELTLLCSPVGLPWQADGWLRDGAGTREATHAELLALLTEQRLPFVMLEGSLTDRLSQAQAALHTATLLGTRPATAAS
jgi:nicotinamide riboside kinase